MNTHQATTEDAILAYLTAVAYLHDPGISNAASMWHAASMRTSVFSISLRDQIAQQGDFVPVAICTYSRAHHQWRVVLRCGANLTLEGQYLEHHGGGE